MQISEKENLNKGKVIKSLGAHTEGTPLVFYHYFGTVSCRMEAQKIRSGFPKSIASLS